MATSSRSYFRSSMIYQESDPDWISLDPNSSLKMKIGQQMILLFFNHKLTYLDVYAV